MLTDDQRAILENAADLLEEQGHAGCQIVRKLARVPDSKDLARALCHHEYTPGLRHLVGLPNIWMRICNKCGHKERC